MLWVAAIMVCSNAFYYRMNMGKAPPLTIIITVYGVHLLFQRNYKWLLPLMFAFVWTYSLFPLLLFAAIIWTFIIAWNERRFGVEAFRLARTHKPDLVLMDLQLPEVSGLEVTRWLKEDAGLRHIPVVAVTAFAMSGDEDRAKSAGCDAYVTKPISVRSFLETVADCLGGASSDIL